jgi:hypothetical protein
MALVSSQTDVVDDLGCGPGLGEGVFVRAVGSWGRLAGHRVPMAVGAVRGACFRWFGRV